MPRRTLLLGIFLAFFCILSPSLVAQQTSSTVSSHGSRQKATAKPEIPGATSVGAETCTTCHSEVAKDFRHAFHALQGVDCEQCHGAGSLHVEKGGDVSKILSFSHRTAAEANAVCLSCHARDARWMAGSHASNKVRCMDCHQIHDRALQASHENRFSYDTATRGALTAASVAPETDVTLRTRSQANDLCLKCHQTEGAQLSLPYHHPLREGKMSCADCHDPHGGPAGNNLRTANKNQLCLGCHAQYRGPFSYQHPPVTENCMLCHTAHGSPNTNLLSVSEPALCLQCHAGHHNGAGLPLPDRCTNCHGSIHGTDVATPSGGSRFVDKGPYGIPVQPPQPVHIQPGASGMTSTSTVSTIRPVPSHVPTYAAGAASGIMGLMSSMSPAPLSGDGTGTGTSGTEVTEIGAPVGAYSITPLTYRFLDGSGFLGRVGEYDTLQQSAGVDASTVYVLPQSHLTVVARGNC